MYKKYVIKNIFEEVLNYLMNWQIEVYLIDCGQIEIVKAPHLLI